MNNLLSRSVAVASLVVMAAGFTGGAAQAAPTHPAKPVTTCSSWEAIGNSTVSARTCVTTKETGKKAVKVRGAVQVKNTGTATAKVTASWTVSKTVGKKKAVKVRTVTVRRALPATGRAYNLGAHGSYSRLDAAGLAVVQSKITVVAPKTGTDTETETKTADL
ncbi:hypothetical protein GCM10009841_25840 [Microlunatus panaciterrae]|uniref:Uncharacterized protein n=1 Tax=Microlunatus panaciterrae TaxID=400768 RepID=A0ABS2RMI7_9ACTN|nr:hypothetical protein [Microlunatus panaciterrae]MBM7799159.1 hypothetical protein [Microlunatus panaciterrae]